MQGNIKYRTSLVNCRGFSWFQFGARAFVMIPARGILKLTHPACWQTIVTVAKNLENLVSAQWHDVKGNAKWDFIKNLWQIVWPLMLGAASWMINWSRHATTWLVWTVFAVVCAASYVVAFCTRRERTSDREEMPKTQEPARPKTAHEVLAVLRNQKNFQKLNGYYEKLQARKIEIERMMPLPYFGKYRERFYEGYKFDEQTQGLIAEIEDFLRLEVKNGSFEIFTDGHGVNPMEPYRTHPMYMHDQKIMREVSQRAIDHLSHYLKQIRTIIELNTVASP
jgi:hypothetical protein